MATTLLDSPQAAPETLPEHSEETRKRWTRAEYRKLGEDGFLSDGKYELVLGEIWKKMGQGRLHTFVVTFVFIALSAIFDPRRIQTQTSLPVGDADPEPDIALLAETLDKYLEVEPTASNTLLVVEASDSTLRSDLTRKVRQYGGVGIPEYWVVDIPNRLLHVFRSPTETGYAEETVLTIDDEVRPLAAPDSAVRVAELLP